MRNLITSTLGLLAYAFLPAKTIDIEDPQINKKRFQLISDSQDEDSELLAAMLSLGGSLELIVNRINDVILKRIEPKRFVARLLSASDNDDKPIKLATQGYTVAILGNREEHILQLIDANKTKAKAVAARIAINSSSIIRKIIGRVVNGRIDPSMAILRFRNMNTLINEFATGSVQGRRKRSRHSTVDDLQKGGVIFPRIRNRAA